MRVLGNNPQTTLIITLLKIVNMVDPLSVIALGITVSQGFLTALSSWKSFEGDIQAAVTQIEDLNRTLSVLSSHLATFPLSGVDATFVEEKIAGCQEGVTALQTALAKLQGCGSGIGQSAESRRKLQHMLFPLKRGNFKELRDVVTDLQQRLDLALKVYHT